MRKSHFASALWKSLIAVALAVVSSEAQDESGGGDSAASIEWQTSYRQAADDANRDGKPLLVRVTASWCGPCQQMKQLTFRDLRVIELVRSEFIPLLIDADAHPELVTGFKVEAYPTTIVVAPDRTILKRLTGFQSAESLVTALQLVSKSQPIIHSVSHYGEAISALDTVNSSQFGFDGYCLVSLLEETRVRRGSPEFTAEHRGQPICFQSEEHRQRFLADPEKYWPVANGQCLVSSREGSFAGPGDPRMAVTWRGKIWMFSDRERQRRFIEAPGYYASDFYYSSEM